MDSYKWRQLSIGGGAAHIAAVLCIVSANNYIAVITVASPCPTSVVMGPKCAYIYLNTVIIFDALYTNFRVVLKKYIDK